MIRRFLHVPALLMLLAAQASVAKAPASDIDRLSRDVAHLESLRAVKDLQRSYAQYAQFGLWTEMAALFTAGGRLVRGDETVSGRQAIARWLRDHFGPPGLAPGALHLLLIDDPLVTLAPDGRSATARWRLLAFTGDGKGGTGIEGGMAVNDYVLEGGRWKIASLHVYPQFQGDYRSGWGNPGGKDLPAVPYHFDPDSAGRPVPQSVRPGPESGATLVSLQHRIAMLNDEDAVRNLQHSYGYYVDRKMWDDVVDLFAEDGVVEIAGLGLYSGRAGVRRAMEAMGPAGLRHGELNDRPQFDTLVKVSASGSEAFARGIELAMLGRADQGQASWEVNIFRNRFVKEGSLWKIREMRVQPLMKADYRTGWGDGGTGPSIVAMPAFLGPNPATGRPVLPHGRPLFAARPLTGSSARSAPPARPRLADLRRRYLRSLAYDSTMNVSAAYGYYLGDGRWDDMSRLFASHGNKQSPFAGYYIGKDRIAAAATARYGPAGTQPARREAGVFHWRPQPVILVSHDGRSTTSRTRLFQLRTSKYDRGAGKPNPNAIQSGMYPNDQFVLEDGVWRLWSITIDEHYFTSPTWQGGWSGAKPRAAGERPAPSPIVATYPPDILLTDLGRREEGFRGGTGETISWPGILPMWFHYRNLVSGRLPENFWPDCVPCRHRPEASMTSHGYELPADGPQEDGRPAVPVD